MQLTVVSGLEARGMRLQHGRVQLPLDGRVQVARAVDRDLVLLPDVMLWGAAAVIAVVTTASNFGRQHAGRRHWDPNLVPGDRPAFGGDHVTPLTVCCVHDDIVVVVTAIIVAIIVVVVVTAVVGFVTAFGTVNDLQQNTNIVKIRRIEKGRMKSTPPKIKEGTEGVIWIRRGACSIRSLDRYL